MRTDGKRVGQRIGDVQKGQILPAKPKRVTFPPIPEDYNNYCVFSQKKKSKKRAGSTAAVKAVRKTKKIDTVARKGTRTNPTRALQRIRWDKDIYISFLG